MTELTKLQMCMCSPVIWPFALHTIFLGSGLGAKP